MKIRKTLLFLFLTLHMYGQKAVFITEVFYDTPLNEQVATSGIYSDGEFIELYNHSEEIVDISNWRMKGGGVTEEYIFPEGTEIYPGAVCILAYRHKKSNFTLDSLFSAIPDENDIVLYQNKIVLANSGEPITLWDDWGAMVDSIYYDGTSNISRPDRLSAPNPDGIHGDYCYSISRFQAMIGLSGDIMINRDDFEKEIATPFEVSLFVPHFRGEGQFLYTYNKKGNNTLRERNTVYLQKASPKNKKVIKKSIHPTMEVIDDITIKVYPNPTKGNIWIEILDANPRNDISFTVVTINGTLVTNGNFSANTASIDLNNYPIGIYLLKIKIDGKTSEWKLIKE